MLLQSQSNTSIAKVIAISDYFMITAFGLRHGIWSRVEAGSGHPGHIFSGSGLTRFIKYPGLTRIDCTIRVFRSFGAWITHS